MCDDRGVIFVPLSIDECRRIDYPLRTDLENLDSEIRSVLTRIRAEARGAGGDETLFDMASSTVLLSIAASIIAPSTENLRETFDPAGFVASANRAAEWVKLRRSGRTLAAGT
jgi:hypothetical protein